MKPLRSMMYVPGNDKKKINKSKEVPADAIILDLEDSVPIGKKEEGRKTVKESLDAVSKTDKEIYVRINGLKTGFFKKDIENIVGGELSGIFIPKSEKKEDIEVTEKKIKKIEKEKDIKSKISIIPLIETAKGIVNLGDLCTVSDRLEAVAFGAVDYTSDLGTDLSEKGIEILYPRSKISNLCSAFEVQAIDYPWVKISDQEGLIEDSKEGKQMGFDGRQVIHPAHLEDVNKIFSPSDDEIKRSKNIVEAFEEAKEKGIGAASLEGEMIDKATYRKAKKTLEKAKMIEDR